MRSRLRAGVREYRYYKRTSVIKSRVCETEFQGLISECSQMLLGVNDSHLHQVSKLVKLWAAEAQQQEKRQRQTSRKRGTQSHGSCRVIAFTDEYLTHRDGRAADTVRNRWGRRVAYICSSETNSFTATKWSSLRCNRYQVIGPPPITSLIHF